MGGAGQRGQEEQVCAMAEERGVRARGERGVRVVIGQASVQHEQE